MYLSKFISRQSNSIHLIEHVLIVGLLFSIAFACKLLKLLNFQSIFLKVLGKIWTVALKYHFRMPPYYTLVL